MNKTILAGCAFLIAISIPFFEALAWPGEVVSVHDGDTITVRNKQGHAVKVRLYGIDCPEMKQKGNWDEQPFAREAQIFVRQLVPTGSKVEVETVGKSYDRIVAIVTPAGDIKTVQEMLTEAGLAWHYAKYCVDEKPICQNMRRHEAEAQWMQRGLWTHESVPPWEWRHKK